MLCFCISGQASAWWNDQWNVRQKVAVAADQAGLRGTEALTDVPVLVRLHTGNFPFLDATEDGRDLRFVGEDDRTVLPHQLESFDAVNEIAFLWVRVPRVDGSRPTTLWLYAANPAATAADRAGDPGDERSFAVLHFREGADATRDDSGRSTVQVAGAARPDKDGIAGGALRLDRGGTLSLTVSAEKRGGDALTVSLWLRAPSAAMSALFLRDANGTGLAIALENGTMVARAGNAMVRSTTPLPANVWTHIAVTVSDDLRLYLDGKREADAPVTGVTHSGSWTFGSSTFEGTLDELTFAGEARSAGWIAFAHATQGAGPGIVALQPPERQGGGAEGSYLAVLLGAVTADGWVVIGVLGVLFLVAAAVMAEKSLLLVSTDRANRQFLAGFRQRPAEMMDPRLLESNWASLEGSGLYRLWRAALGELASRVSDDSTRPVRGSIDTVSLAAIRAVVEAVATEESERLNRRMVLLTIAISGGPFLGLLGTVTGVMITFAAIAAAGDVNINAIAPGIAAALVATVAGLGVAIPALFAYNMFASRIRTATLRMNTFVDELVTRIAETHGVRGGG